MAPALAGAASAALFATTFWAPPLGFALCLASPLPVALSAWDRGPRGAVAATLVATAVVAVVAGPLAAALYAAQFASGGCVLGLALRAGRSPQAAVGGYAAVTAGAFGASLVVLALGQGAGPVEFFTQALSEAVNQASGVLLQGDADPQAAVAVQAWADETLRILTASFPGLFAGLSVLTGWLNALGLRRLRPPADGLSWTAWRAPEAWIWVLIGSGLLGFLAPGAAGRLGLNLFLPAAAVYFLQGIAVVHHLFVTRGFPKVFRAVAYALLFFQLPMMLLVTGLGAFDLWFDFRSRWTPRPPAEG